MFTIIEKKRSAFFGNPIRVICVSFAIVIAVGTLLLTLPISSRAGTFTHPLDALFTATSATCVTGLVVFDTYTHWNLFGQFVIITLIQIGGLGLVTFATFFSLATGKKLGLRSMQLAQESINSGTLADVTRMVRRIVFSSLAIEAVGAVLLSLSFVPKYGIEGIFISIFLAISAFCNAGFDILGFEGQYTSLTNYVGDPIVVFTISALIIVGGLGFVVWHDLYDFKKTGKLTLQSRIVLMMTGILLAAGFVIFLVGEWTNPETMGPLTPFEKVLGAFFQSVTTRTAGFNSIPMEPLHPITKGLSCLLMFIGAAPGSTGGGVKITTLAVIIMTILCVAQGREDTIIFHRKVGKPVVYKSLAIMSVSLVLVSMTAFFINLMLAGVVGGLDAFFEATSAFATVGLSVGVTGVANPLSKLLLILLMFLGRVGPMSFAYSITARQSENRREIIPDGRVMVG